MKNILALTGLDSTALSASEDAQQQRDDLIATTGVILSVATKEEAEDAGRALTAVKTFTRSIEDARQTVGGPVLDLTKRINALAKTLTAELEQEAARLAKMLGTWNAEQERIAERKRLEALAEEQRIIDETKKKLDDAEAAGASAKKLDKIEDKAIGQLTQARANTAATAPTRLSGISTKRDTIVEITDIHALYKAHPMLVSLTPNMALIKAALKTTPGGLPGVTSREESKAIVR